MKFKIKLPAKLAPYSGVIYFVVILICSHFFWKFTMLGDESDTVVTFFGLDVSAPFNFMSRNIAQATGWLMHLFGSTIHLFLDPYNLLQYDNGVAVRVVWACSGLKQAYIFFCIIAFNRGPFLKKLWYIPAGLVVVYVVNVLRIASITAIIENHPEWFDFLHEHLFKYLFYAIMFGMWVLWEEKIGKISVRKRVDS